MRVMVISTLEQLADALLVLIAKHGSSVKVVEAIREAGNETD